MQLNLFTSFPLRNSRASWSEWNLHKFQMDSNGLTRYSSWCLSAVNYLHCLNPHRIALHWFTRSLCANDSVWKRNACDMAWSERRKVCASSEISWSCVKHFYYVSRLQRLRQRSRRTSKASNRNNSSDVALALFKDFSYLNAFVCSSFEV